MTSTTVNQVDLDLKQINDRLAKADPSQIVEWAAEQFGDGLVMASSFGVQAAVMLHMVSRVAANMPIIFIDTGFLFPQTYRFAEQLIDRLNLNVKTYQSPLSPARMAALHGKLWEQDKQGMDKYHQIRKVEPMQRALRELKVTAWLSGLRRVQTEYRENLSTVDVQDGRYKILPILNWSNQDIDDYLSRYDLPHHPLRDEGYAWVGDWHSTGHGGDEHDSRFKGLKQECGLHIPETKEESQSRDSSAL